MTAYSRPYPRSIPRAAQVFAALTLGFGAFLAFVIAWTLGYQLLYAGRIFPGVTVAGVDLSGLSPSDAALKLNQTLSFPVSGKVVFRDGGNVWLASPVELGMVFDASSSAQAAYRLGRNANPFAALSDQLNARKRGADAAPVIIFDQRLAYAYVNNLAAGINRPAVEASLKIEGINVVAQPGQVGRRVDVDATLVFLSAQLQAFRDVEVPLVVIEESPLIMDVSAQAETARQILSASLQLSLTNAVAGDPGPWMFEPSVVAGMLTVKRVDNGGQAEIRVGLESGAFAQLLIPIAGQVDRKAKNARFHFDDEGANPTRELVLDEPSTTGRTTDVPATIAAVNDALMRGEHAVALVVKEEQPGVPDTATAESLGIREKIMEQTTYFYGSDPARVQNIRAAAAQFHGVFVPPGQIPPLRNRWASGKRSWSKPPIFMGLIRRACRTLGRPRRSFMASLSLPARHFRWAKSSATLPWTTVLRKHGLFTTGGQSRVWEAACVRSVLRSSAPRFMQVSPSCNECHMPTASRITNALPGAGATPNWRVWMLRYTFH